MTKRFSRFLLPLLLIWAALSGPVRAAVTVQCRVDPAEINVGEQAMVSYTLQGGSVDDFQLPQVDGLTPGETRTASQFSLDNGSVSQSVVQSFGVIPTHAGTFIIPSFNIRTSEGQILKTQALTLHVVGSASTPAASNPNPANGPVFLPPSASAPPTLPGPDTTSTISVPTDADGQPLRVFQVVTPQTTEAYVGQSVPLKIEFFIQIEANAQQDSLPVLIGSDFLMNNLSLRPQQDEVNVGDQTYLHETWVTALAAPKAGDFPLQATRDTYWNKTGSIVGGNDPFGQLFGRSGQLMHQEIASNRLVMHVHPLPEQGRPGNFTGAIGKFEITGNAVPTSVGLGDPVTLRFTVTGEGNFDYVRSPSLSPNPSWKTYNPSSKINYEDEAHTQAMKTFEQAIIPQKSGVMALPVASFSYFDPSTKVYVTTPVPLPTITVTGTALTSSSLAQSEASTAPTAPTLVAAAGNVFAPNQLNLGTLTSDLAPGYRHSWFWLLQTALGVLIMLGIVFSVFKPRADPRRAARAQRFASLRQEQDAMSAAARQGDAVLFFIAARRTVQLQLAERWRLSPEAITLAEIAQQDPSLAETVAPLFTEADDVIYSGNSRSNLNLQEWDRRVREMLQTARV